MKSVLISITPKWCGLIANGKKTIEVRKTRPKLETPFNCYIYCTNPNTKNPNELLEIHGTDGKIRKANGKVIGEFVCDNIECVDIPYPAFQAELDKRYIEQSCFSYWQLHRYFYHDSAYFWHISDLFIYDKPRELSDFHTICKYRNDDGSCRYSEVECDCVKFDFNSDWSVNFAECLNYMSRPPQSWCYVETI